MAKDVNFADIAVIARTQAAATVTPPAGTNRPNDETPKPPRVRNLPSVEIALDSAPDCAIRRTVGNRSKLLILMPTQHLYCIMDERSKNTEPVTTSNLLTFSTNGASGYLPLPNWAGGSIDMNLETRKKLLKAFTSTDFHELLMLRATNYNVMLDYNVRSMTVQALLPQVRDHQAACDFARELVLDKSQNAMTCLTSDMLKSVINLDHAIGLRELRTFRHEHRRQPRGMHCQHDQ